MERASLLLLLFLHPVAAFWPLRWPGAAASSPAYDVMGAHRAAGLDFDGKRRRDALSPSSTSSPPSSFASPSLSLSPLDLPGFTRSVLAPDHALLTPESRTWSPLPGWVNATAAVLISPAPPMRAGFLMALGDVGAGGTVGPPLAGGGPGAAAARRRVQRAVFVLDGSLEVRAADAAAAAACPGLEEGAPLTLRADGFIYLPPGCALAARLTSPAGAGLVFWDKLYSRGGEAEGGAARPPPPLTAHASASALPTADPGGGEAFALRRLLPPPDHPSSAPDFNIHLMDFDPGQVLVTKEVHFNQHGLLMLQGGGLYRLNERFYPVSAGDAIWMAPFVPQWFGALGSGRARYIIFKDTGADPLLPLLA